MPVGKDQTQHLEIARVCAQAFNAEFGTLLGLPEAATGAEVGVIPGLDGRKMSKSYGNTIPLFLKPQELRKRVMKIQTDSKRPEEPKAPENCTVFTIYKHLAPPDEVSTWEQRYRKGGLAYGEIKQALFEETGRYFAESRQIYLSLLKDPETIDRKLTEGAVRARDIARPMLNRVRESVGVALV